MNILGQVLDMDNVMMDRKRCGDAEAYTGEKAELFSKAVTLTYFEQTERICDAMSNAL